MANKIFQEDKLPVYEIYIEDDDCTGIKFVSIVDDPAIEVRGFAFSDQREFKFAAKKDQQIIVGPAMIPNKKIYRYDEETGEEYYVVFTADMIRKIANKFNRGNNNTAVNVDHSNRMVDAFIQESWIVEDAVYDKSKYYGFNLPVGSWFISMKIEDAEFWKNEVVDMGKYSFSIEGLLGHKLVTMRAQPTLEQIIDSLTDEEILDIAEEILKN